MTKAKQLCGRITHERSPLSVFWGVVSAFLQNLNSFHMCQLKVANKGEMKVVSAVSNMKNLSCVEDSVAFYFMEFS